MGAGLGTRLKPFSDRFPKPLIPVLGVPCIEFSLLMLENVGVKKTVVNLHAHAGQVREYLAKRKDSGMKVLESDESATLLGSAGGFRKALSLLGREVFFSMNGDVVTDVDLQALARRHFELQAKHDVWMTLSLIRGKTLENTAGSYRELFTDESTGLITGFGEKKSKVPFYSGVAVFDPRCFQSLPLGQVAEFVPSVLEPLIRANKVGFQWSDNLWFDVGSPELWWQTHFDLRREYEAGNLPHSWQQVLDQRASGVYVSESQGVVDYDQARSPGKNYIQLENIRYEIKGVGSSA